MGGLPFVIHTYNSMLIKLLAAEIISGHGLTTTKQPAQAMSALMSNASLVNTLRRDVEMGGIFTQAGINGFVEESIFGWYLDVAEESTYSEKIILALRNVLATLSLYRTDSLVCTRDVLRDLYQALVPGKLRQSLGEFYTPDWLVDFTIDKAKKNNWLKQRVLDPTCGSGAFLIGIIRRKIAEAKAAKWTDQDIVKHLCADVWGFDLNPLAVQTARVNFLMEIAYLLKSCPGLAIEIPVLLADAIYSPASNPKINAQVVKYHIGSQNAGLDINLPSALAFDHPRLDKIFKQMEETVGDGLIYEQSEKLLISAGLITKCEAKNWNAPLKYTYDQILALHKKQWDGVWFGIIRNFFWSATAGYFDYIIGNPPWVRWSKLPEMYRERVKPTCEAYGIFSKTKRHGGNELDISAMITYTTADKWLKKNGRLAFVITGTLFKNPSSAGFRDFKFNKNDHLIPVAVDDLKALKPFSDASNHTTVAIFDKSDVPGKYPVPYRIWNRKDGVAQNIPIMLSLNEVLERINITELEATPVGGIGSPWAVLSKGRHSILKILSGVCDWVSGRKGITADLNGVYFVPIIQMNGTLVQVTSRPDAGKKDIGQARTAWVEPDLLYPLIKGVGDFDACYLKLESKPISERLFTFVPNQGIGKLEYNNSQNAMNSASLSKTKSWFSGYKTLLENRSTYRRQMKGAPFYAVYNVGEYTFKPWKVLWPEMSSKFYAAVASSSDVPIIGKRVYIPDHKIYFAAFDNKETAYFLCGLLNTCAVKEWIESHNVSIQVGDIFKHLRLPKYNQKNNEHSELASLVEKSHNTHDASQRTKIIEDINNKGESILKTWAG